MSFPARRSGSRNSSIVHFRLVSGELRHEFSELFSSDSSRGAIFTVVVTGHGSSASCGASGPAGTRLPGRSAYFIFPVFLPSRVEGYGHHDQPSDRRGSPGREKHELLIGANYAIIRITP